jgi:hypothetical protein
MKQPIFSGHLGLKKTLADLRFLCQEDSQIINIKDIDKKNIDD